MAFRVTGIRGAALLAGLLVVAPSLAGADPPHWTGRSTLGFDLYVPGTTLGDDADRTGFWDRYTFLSNKNVHSPFFLDLTDLDVGYVRDDGHYLFRLQRDSQNWLNERSRLLFHVPGQVRLDVLFRNYRSSRLREFPQSSGATLGSSFATKFNDNTGTNSLFRIRRSGITAQLRIRPGLLGLGEESILRSLTLGARLEHRTGRRQLRLMLDGDDVTDETAFNFARWRGVEQKVKETALRPSAQAVLALGGFTAVARFDFEHFRVNQPQINNNTLDVLAAAFDATQTGAITTTGATGLSTVDYLPDTDRYQGKLRLARTFGDRASLRLAGQWTELKQKSFSNLENNNTFRHNRLHYGSAAVAGDLELTDGLSLNGFGKLSIRGVSMRPNSLLMTQVDERINRRREWTLGAELAQRMRHSQLALGYEGKLVRRDLDFQLTSGLRSITERNALLRDSSNSHTWYLSGRCRPARGVQARAKIHYTVGVQTGLPTEPEWEYGLQGRLSWAAPTQPLVLSTYGKYRYFQNEDFSFVGETAGSRSNDVKNDGLKLGADATYVPADGVALFVSTIYQRDSADDEFNRTNLRRFRETEAGAGDVNYFYDDSLNYHGTTMTAVVGGSLEPSKGVKLSASYSFTRSDAAVEGSGDVLDRFTAVQSNIHSVDLAAEYAVSDALQLGASYRYSDYADQVPTEGLLLSEHEHILGVQVSYRFGKPAK